MSERELIEAYPERYVLPSFPLGVSTLYKRFTVPLVGKYVERIDVPYSSSSSEVIEFVFGVKGSSNNFGKEQRLRCHLVPRNKQKAIYTYRALTGKEKLPRKLRDGHYRVNLEAMDIRGLPAIGLFSINHSYSKAFAPDGSELPLPQIVTVLQSVMPQGYTLPEESGSKLEPVKI